ncbi:hypothetical protein J6590_009290 [Homalodisca vitripennis]|nr:hypothetical protein J6590_009290 [Homalodisca vitripennis]
MPDKKKFFLWIGKILMYHPDMIYPQGLISYYEYVDGDHGDTRAEYVITSTYL